MEFFEKIETPCPENIGKTPDSNKLYFRRLKSNPASSTCFRATKIDRPALIAQAPLTDCHLFGLSVFDDIEEFMIRFRTRKAIKEGKPILVGEISFNDQDGLICQSGNLNHYTFWRGVAFDFTKTKVSERPL